ncbi:MAG: glycosyltransferase [Chloroflexi bacterium]|nr:glycosyltransferase [Chloroflexota bacterium]
MDQPSTLTDSNADQLVASVVIPAYNAARTLPRCLAAFAAQTVESSKYEVIVVDDGSEDQTFDLAVAAGVKVERIDHQGAAVARNVGVSCAKAPVILFTDADCEPAPDFIVRILEPLVDPDVSGARGVYRTKQSKWVARFVQLEYEERYRRIGHYQTRHGSINALDTSYAAYKRKAFMASGGFDAQFTTASSEDHELSFRMSQQGHVFRLAPRAFVYHQHVSSVLAYIRRKYRIGYWKALLAKMHPQYAVFDSHMTQSLKLQIVAAGLMGIFLLLSVLWPVALWPFLICLFIFVISSIPLHILVAQQDPYILLITLFMLFVRATASGCGFVWGLLRAYPDAEGTRSGLHSSNL